MKEMILTSHDIDSAVGEICRGIAISEWTPDVIVGIPRGGLIPGVMISHYLDKPFLTIDNFNLNPDEDEYQNILIVDDICDTGDTFHQVSDLIDLLPEFSFRFCCVVNNEASDFLDVSYSGISINKSADPCWVVFPWECWWRKA